MTECGLSNSTLARIFSNPERIWSPTTHRTVDWIVLAWYVAPALLLVACTAAYLPLVRQVSPYRPRTVCRSPPLLVALLLLLALAAFAGAAAWRTFDLVASDACVLHAGGSACADSNEIARVADDIVVWRPLGVALICIVCSVPIANPFICNVSAVVCAALNVVLAGALAATAYLLQLWCANAPCRDALQTCNAHTFSDAILCVASSGALSLLLLRSRKVQAPPRYTAGAPGGHVDVHGPPDPTARRQPAQSPIAPRHWFTGSAWV